MPECSVVMSVYNARATLDEALASVLAQRDADFEYIAIDDGSTDGSAEILARAAAADSRLRVVSRERNAGLTANLNRALELARAPLVARIDADDLWHAPDKLARQLAFLREHPDHALLGTWATLRGEASGAYRWPSDDAAIRRRILLENCFVHASVVFRTALARELGGYRADTYCEDYDLWLRIGKRAKFANLPSELMTYTVSSTGINATKRSRQIRDCLSAVREHHAGYPNYAAALLKWRGLQVRIALQAARNGTRAKTSA